MSSTENRRSQSRLNERTNKVIDNHLRGLRRHCGSEVKLRKILEISNWGKNNMTGREEPVNK